MSTFSNPIGAGLSPERIDQGVDYGGSGPLYALGNGTITSLYNSGWPGGTFLTIHLDSGQYIYYAENINPLVKIGDKVTAGQHIANATGGQYGIEVGFASPPELNGGGLGQTMAWVTGQSDKSGSDPGAYTTAYGQLMSDLIHSLGGPAGLKGGPPSGSVPSSYGISVKGVTATAQDTSGGSGGGGGLLSFPSQITQFFNDANTFVSALMWITKPGNWVRIVAFLAGIVLLMFAIHALVAAGSRKPLVSSPKVVPIPV